LGESIDDGVSPPGLVAVSSAYDAICVLGGSSCVLFYYVCIAVLHTSVARLLARSQYPESPATGHHGAGFP